LNPTSSISGSRQALSELLYDSQALSIDGNITWIIY